MCGRFPRTTVGCLLTFSRIRKLRSPYCSKAALTFLSGALTGGEIFLTRMNCRLEAVLRTRGSSASGFTRANWKAGSLVSAKAACMDSVPLTRCYGCRYVAGQCLKKHTYPLSVSEKVRYTAAARHPSFPHVPSDGAVVSGHNMVCREARGFLPLH